MLTVLLDDDFVITNAIAADPRMNIFSVVVAGMNYFEATRIFPRISFCVTFSAESFAAAI